ncbi:MAG: HAMP domain-containing sensor histidine kinase, partial [Ectothiorhodospiraceae bacterium]
FQRSQQDARLWQGHATLAEVEALLARFVGAERAAEAVAPYAPATDEPESAATAPPELIDHAERLLAGTIGSASARVMVASIVQGEALTFDGVMQILDATSRAIGYSQRLEHKSRELERVTTELRAANERLKELDQLKDEFVSMVSHELRTPLTSIRAFAEILRDNPEMDADQRHEFLAVVVRESERLSRLINQVLDLSKIESGRADWTLETLDLRETVNQAVAATSQLFSERGVPLEKDVPDEPCRIKGDPDRLVQVVINLLSNAVKFSDPERGPVSINLASNGSVLELRVTDSGPGIPAAERERIFDKFHQISDQQAGKPKGSGLGLAICRRIVELHWGRIDVINASNGGACFRVRLPSAGGEHCDVQ